MMTHTPGPWRAVPQPGRTIGVHMYTHQVMYGDDCLASLLTEPDARLIAASPDLLEACERVMSLLDGDPNREEERHILLAAIAKAKGNA